MKYRIEIVQDQEEDVVIFAKENTAQLRQIEELLRKDHTELFGYGEQEMIRLDAKDVYCFFVETGRVYAKTERQSLQVRERLYVLEEKFAADFIKINQSCLVNKQKIERFRSTFGGALEVILKNGYRDYISRRQLKEVKERMGLGR